MHDLEPMGVPWAPIRSPSCLRKHKLPAQRLSSLCVSRRKGLQKFILHLNSLLYPPLRQRFYANFA